MVNFRIDRPRRLIEVEIVGLHRYEESEAYVRRLLADPDYDSSFSQLIDCRKADLSELTPDALQAIAANTLSVPGRRLAIVYMRDMNEGVARLFATYLALAENKGQIAVFQDRDAALAWIEELRLAE